WSSGWQDELLSSGDALRNTAELLDASVLGSLASLGLNPRPSWSAGDLRALKSLATALHDTRGHDLSIAFDREFSRCADALKELEASILAYGEAHSALVAS